jgi:hypothetical protein
MATSKMSAILSRYSRLWPTTRMDTQDNCQQLRLS